MKNDKLTKISGLSLGFFDLSPVFSVFDLKKNQIKLTGF
jgi:hypothetical protein